MEVHEDADESTASAVSDAQKQDQEMSSITGSNNSNDNVGLGLVENQSPIKSSTPEVPVTSLNQPGQAILTKLAEIQDLCNATMDEVDSLKARWESKEEETKHIQVSFFLHLLITLVEYLNNF